jgi:hypothetical protein
MASKKEYKKLSAAEAPWKVRDYSKDPFFVQKAATARQIIEKHGLPKELSAKKK